MKSFKQFTLNEKEKNRIRKPKKGRKVTLKEFDSIYKLMIRKKNTLYMQMIFLI